jgi:hypothetical protein
VPLRPPRRVADGNLRADDQPAVRGSELWSRICAHSGGICNPPNTHDEGTLDIVYKRGRYFYVTFHGFNPATRQGLRGVAKTVDFHRWIVAGPDLPGAPNLCCARMPSLEPGVHRRWRGLDLARRQLPIHAD